MDNTKLWIGSIEPGTSDDEIRDFAKSMRRVWSA